MLSAGPSKPDHQFVRSSAHSFGHTSGPQGLASVLRPRIRKLGCPGGCKGTHASTEMSACEPGEGARITSHHAEGALAAGTVLSGAFAHLLSPLAFSFLSENLPPRGAVPEPSVGPAAAWLLLGVVGAAPRLSGALTPVSPPGQMQTKLTLRPGRRTVLSREPAHSGRGTGASTHAW